MLTENQRQIFERLLDANHEMKQESNAVKKFELLGQVNELKEELKEDMGEESYNRFMNMGTRMFASKV